MERQGVVLELQDEFAVLLTKDGQFVRVPRAASMAVGLEYQFESSRSAYTYQRNRYRSRGRKRLWQLMSAGVAACVAIAAGVVGDMRLHPAGVEAYAFVSLDINPSITLQVSKDYKVIDATGLNADGVTLLKHLSVRGESLKTAVTDIVQQAAASHMLSEDDTILVATAPLQSSVDVQQLQVAAQEDVRQAVQSNSAARAKHPSVYGVALSTTVWKAAREANVSPGKLAAYLVARNEGMNVSLSALSGTALGQIFSQATPHSTLLQALQSNNLQQVETEIEQMVKQGILSPDVPKSTGKSDGNHAAVGQNNAPLQNTSPDGTNPSPPDGKSKIHNGHDGGQNDNRSGVTIQIGNSTFSLPLGGVGQSVVSDNGIASLLGTNQSADGQKHNSSKHGTGHDDKSDAKNAKEQGGRNGDEQPSSQQSGEDTSDTTWLSNWVNDLSGKGQTNH